MLAKLSGAIYKNIDAVISIVGDSGDFIDKLSYDNIKIDMTKPYKGTFNFPTNFKVYFWGIPLFRLIAPKPLVISSATRNYGLGFYPFEPKYKILYYLVDYYKSLGFEDYIKLNIFQGIHESDFEGEFSAFMKLYDKL